MKVTRLMASAAVSLTALAGCAAGGGDQPAQKEKPAFTTRAVAGPLSVGIPDGWKDVSDTDAASGGWETAFVDSTEEPTVLIRVAPAISDSGVESAVATMEGRDLFAGTYGGSLKVDSTEDIQVENADEAIEVTFHFETDAGKPQYGHWWFVSSAQNGGKTSAVETISDEKSEDLIKSFGDSLEYKP